MVDLAQQAFSTNNFGLAADIYERTIRENGPQAELYLGLADSFARAGQITQAFEAYTNAFRLGRVTHEKLKHLVTALVETLRVETAENNGCRQDSVKRSCMFTCELCLGVLNDPVTIKCGHTFCRKCLERDCLKACKVCGIVHCRLKPSSVRTNIVLANLIHKWFPNSCRATELKAEGNTFFEKSDFQSAITAYSEAIQLSDGDHLLFSNRSYAYAALDQFDRALEDAEKVVKLRPNWSKGYFRKGSALFKLGKYEDAVIAFLQCLALDREVTSAKEYLSRTLHKILKQLPPDDPKQEQRQLALSSSPFQQLLSSNFRLSPFLLHPELGAHTLTSLKQIIDSTVAQASSFQAPQPTLSSLSPTSSSSISTSLSSSFAAVSSGPTLLLPGGNNLSSLSGLDMNSTDLEGSMAGHLRWSEAQRTAVVADNRKIDQSMLFEEDLECSLCYRLFYLPVTTPCGHSFCRQCLDRCLDHQTSCPMCKSSLAEYLAERRSTVTDALQAIIVTFFPQQHQQRHKVHEDEVSELAKMGQDTQHEIPVFVCTLSFPTVPCPLHVFEPRYRLMIRQCMEVGTRQFGMCTCLTDNEENFSNYGCMLEIRDVHYFHDGRSLVDTVGGRRFRVLSRGKRDGYNTAKVEFLHDDHISQTELPEIQTLQTEVYTATKAWLDSLPTVHKSRILQHFGNIPDLDPNPGNSPNGPAWAWWVVAVLPLENRVQLLLLAMCSHKERLESLRRVLHYLSRYK